MSDTPLRITRTISGVAAPVLPVAYRCEAPGCDGSAPVILDAYKGPPHCIGLVAGAGHAPQ